LSPASFIPPLTFHRLVRASTVTVDSLGILLWAGASVSLIASSGGNPGNDCPHDFPALARGFGWFGIIAAIAAIATFVDNVAGLSASLAPVWGRLTRRSISVVSVGTRIAVFCYIGVASAFIYGEEGGYTALQISCPTRPLRATAVASTAITIGFALQLVAAFGLTVSAWCRQQEPACH